MKELNEFENEKYAVKSNGCTSIPDSSREAYQEEMSALVLKYSNLNFDSNDRDFMLNQVGMLAQQEEEATTIIKYNEEEIREQHKKIFDEVYRIEVEVMEGGTLPCKAHKTDAGFDLYATEDVPIINGEVTKHPLNIKMKLPKGCYAQITSKSGLGSKGLLVYAGVIDESYRGIPHVVCTLLVDGVLHIKKSQKIAQMIIEPYSSNHYVAEVECIDENTARGTKGFGSTGEV